MKNAINNLIVATWDSFVGRIAILGLAIGWVPFYFLTMAHSALRA